MRWVGEDGSVYVCTWRMASEAALTTVERRIVAVALRLSFRLCKKGFFWVAREEVVMGVRQEVLFALFSLAV